MYYSYSYFFVRDLLQRLLYSFHRTLNICLYDDRQFLHLAFGYLREQIVQRYLLELPELVFLSFVLTLFYQFSCQLLVLYRVESFARGRYFAQTCYLHRCRRTCFADGSAPEICHSPYPADRCARNNDIARMQCAVLYQQCSHRALALVKPCLDDSTLSQPVRISFQFLYLSNQQYVFKQFINAHARLCRYRHRDNIAAPLFYYQFMFGKLLLYSVRVSALFIHLVYRNYHRYARRLSMVYRFNCLRHDTVISRNDQYCDIGYVRSSRSHRSKCFVTGSVQESYLLSVALYLICTDMLCDAACFTLCNVRISYPVQYRSLAVIDVTHYDYYRAALFQILRCICFVLDKSFLDGDVYFLLDLCAQFLSHQ
ncbi:conserved domain protein [Ruminococcus albus 8]|uniref:Conserved domain protein n=1 Tax=Ruminococcus albus 8 TaxID=246199 RepID=E9S7S7_RUMAL|nr:conserved domain protein [Ruminococcus albus 8]